MSTILYDMPATMDRHFHREDYKNGKLTITFEDAAHLADSWNFARKIGKEVEFEQAIMRLISVALGGAVPQSASTWPDGTQFAATEGRERQLSVYPDGHTVPGFGWHEEKGLTGGLIWHRHSGNWSIHT